MSCRTKRPKVAAAAAAAGVASDDDRARDCGGEPALVEAKTWWAAGTCGE